MAFPTPESFQLQVLTAAHGRNEFDCGKPELNEYLARYARQHLRTNSTKTVVVVDPQWPTAIMGFFSHCASSVRRQEIREGEIKDAPKLPAASACLLARLALDRRYQGKKLREYLLFQAMGVCLSAMEAIGAILLVVEAKPDAISFYEKYGFKRFELAPSRLYLSYGTLRKTVRPLPVPPRAEPPNS